MRSECIDAVTQAIGRSLTAQEVQGIEDRINRQLRNHGRDDPQAALSTSMAARMAEAGKTAAQELVHDAWLKKYRIAKTVEIHHKIETYLGKHANKANALSDLIAFSATGRSDVMSVESQADAIRNIALSNMMETLEATNPKFFGLFEDVQGIHDLVSELHGESTGNAAAAAGAKAFHGIAEDLRQRYNQAGSDIGKLESWAVPQHHSQRLVAIGGRKFRRESPKDRGEDNTIAMRRWIDFVLPKLDRKQYVNPDGTLMDESKLSDFLAHAWETIATGGANKNEPGQFRGNGMRANKGSQERQIHFKDAAAFEAYQHEFGDRPLYDVLIGHVNQMARDVALLENFGPNPDHTFAFFRDKIFQEGALSKAENLGKHHKKAMRMDNLYNYVAGHELPVGSERLARAFDDARNWLSSTRLGSAFLTSFSDNATMYLTAHVNHLPAMELMTAQLRTLNPANQMEKRIALRNGLGMNAFIGNMNRFGSESLGDGFSRRMATVTLRASGLIAATEARKRAFGVVYLSALGRITRDFGKLDDLDSGDYRLLKHKGITDTDWEVWRRAEPEDWGSDGGDTMLTAGTIYRIPDAELADLGDPATLKRQAATRLLGAALEESNVAVIEPGARERAGMTFGLQRGTWRGELGRSILLFKSFPISMITRHVMRGLNMPTGTGKAAYLAALVAGSTVAGMASMQAKNIAAGRDPLAMDNASAWGAAVLQGGALSIFGDFLFTDTTKYGSTPFEILAGPVLGEGVDVLRLVQDLAWDRKNLGGDSVRFARSNIPMINLWYTKAALNHMIFHNLEEYFSPGYLRRMKKRSLKVYGQRYWWEPGTNEPQRAPDFEAALGKDQ